MDDTDAMFALKPGDVVNYELEDYVVESQITYSSSRLSWREWVLNSGDTDNRITVVVIGSELLVGKACFIEGNPGDQMIRSDGQVHDLKVNGRADASMVYDTGATRYDRAEFWHYRDKGAHLIAVRRGHLGEWALGLEAADPQLFEVYSA